VPGPPIDGLVGHFPTISGTGSLLWECLPIVLTGNSFFSLELQGMVVFSGDELFVWSHTSGRALFVNMLGRWWPPVQ
jgi:hypothetical protein